MSSLRPRQPRDRGASAVEYALLLAAIGAVIVGVVFGLGGRIRSAVEATTTCYASKGVNCAAAAPAPQPVVVAPVANVSHDDGSDDEDGKNAGNGSGNGSGNNGNGNSNGKGTGNGKGNSSGKDG